MQSTQTATVSYVKTAECLTISANGKMTFIKDKDGKFTKAIVNGDMGKVGQFFFDDNLSLSQLNTALKLSHHQEFVSHGNKLFFASIEGLIEIEPAIAGRLIDLKEAGLPYHPLLKFWVKFSTSTANTTLCAAAREQLFNWVGTPMFPLTWDGCLVAYFRAHVDRLPASTTIEPISLTSFRPLNRSTLFNEDLEEEIAGRKFNLRVGEGYNPLQSLSQIESLCMDLGSIYEVQVEPSDLVGFTVAGGCSRLHANTAYGIRSLGLSTTETNDGFIDLPVENCEGGLALRAPNSAAATGAYLSELVGSSVASRDRLSAAANSLDRIAVTSC